MISSSLFPTHSLFGAQNVGTYLVRTSFDIEPTFRGRAWNITLVTSLASSLEALYLYWRNIQASGEKKIIPDGLNTVAIILKKGGIVLEKAS